MIVIVRVLAALAAIGVLFIIPVWEETGRGRAVFPFWWPESGVSRTLLMPEALIAGLAILILVLAVVWPRRTSRRRA